MLSSMVGCWLAASSSLFAILSSSSCVFSALKFTELPSIPYVKGVRSHYLLAHRQERVFIVPHGLCVFWFKRQLGIWSRICRASRTSILDADTHTHTQEELHTSNPLRNIRFEMV